MKTLVENLISDVDRQNKFENVAMDVVDEMAFSEAERVGIIEGLFWAELIKFLKEMINQCLENRLKRAMRLSSKNNRRHQLLCGRIERALERNEHLKEHAQSLAGGLLIVGENLTEDDWAELKG